MLGWVTSTVSRTGPVNTSSIGRSRTTSITRASGASAGLLGMLGSSGATCVTPCCVGGEGAAPETEHAAGRGAGPSGQGRERDEDDGEAAREGEARVEDIGASWMKETWERTDR